MMDGYIKTAAASPKVQVADCEYNGTRMIELVGECIAKGVSLVVFPELCITGYTCGDLFFQKALLNAAVKEVVRIKEALRCEDIIAVVGLPLAKDGKLYNVAAVLYQGKVLGMIPKINIPNYGEFNEVRYFSGWKGGAEWVSIPELGEEEIPFGSQILFQCKDIASFTLGVEICEDLWVPVPPSSFHAMAGATVIANLSASNETPGKAEYRRALVTNQSGRLICGYLYADAGEGESTTDLVFAGHNLAGDNGMLLSENHSFQENYILADLNLEKYVNERRRLNTYPQRLDGYLIIPFTMKEKEISFEEKIPKLPFVPDDKAQRESRCSEILMMQAQGLKKRLEHMNCTCVLLGISGGLDSTLALLVTVRAFDLLGIPHSQIKAVTMPCFGTTDRTYQNAVSMIRELGADLTEIPIHQEVELHLKQIGHDIAVHDVTYENAQARVRTLVLMDLANQYHGLLVGTGDMSELALGWATYNGDHMSMYGVNASVPKTLVRHMVLSYAETADETLKKVLIDVLDTPVSPELLPPDGETIRQKTEDLVGPYDLHDFFLYYMLRFGYEPSKIYRLAVHAFDGDYDNKTILDWQKTFYRRFFSQQYKRSCMPDGPKVGMISLSPRGDLRMPSDAQANVWLRNLEEITHQKTS